MEILSSIAGKITEFIVAPIGRQAGYLLFYKDNFKELRDQIDELEKMKERIQHAVEAEGRTGREIEADVVSWQNKVDETIKEANQLCEDPRRANAGCSRWSFPNLKSRHQLSRNAKKMAENIVQVGVKGKFERVGYIPPLNIANFISTARASEKLDSRNLVKKDIVLSLRDPKISKIGVYGLSGVGKTTLVNEVAKQVKDDKLFDVVVMATISQTSDMERIQDVIADQLGLHFEVITTIGRASRLCERIKKEKAILLILDDIWEKIDLEKLGIPSVDVWEKNNLEKLEAPSKENYAGCKLLFTSRSQDILEKNETQQNFILKILNDLESWSLFEDMVGDAVKDANLQNIATQVAQRCAGLPALIVTIAKSLKNKSIYYWRDVLNNLERVDHRDMHATFFSALEFNYNRLEDDEMKELFLLCGALGTFIWFSDLLKYVFGLGILKHINSIEDARIRLFRIIDDLKASCLLLDDDASAGVIKMHDIVCEVAISIASRDQYVFTMKRNARWQDWPGKDFLERCTKIILERCCIQKLPKRLDCPNLKLLIIDSTDNRTLEIPHTFFEGMGNLEVLDLTGMIVSLLPASIASLSKLKALCLYQCYLKDMTGIGALKNLEILSFVNSSLDEFPGDIGHLTLLRMLDLNNSGIEAIPSNVLCKLTKIEELYMGNTSIRWEVESSTKQNKNASLAEIWHLKSLTTLEIQIREAWLLPRDIMFEKLERYKIVMGDKWDWSSNKGALRLLKLKLGTSIHLEHGIKTLTKKVEDLYLDEIGGISNVLFQLDGEGFRMLKNLHIQNNGKIQHIVNTMERNQTPVVFPELEVLILHNLNNLVKICHGPLPINSFGKLSVIKVKSCEQLVYLFSVSMVKALSQLLEIEVSKCNSMKMIVFVENGDSGTTIDDKIDFDSLRTLSLCHLPVVDDFCSNKLTSSMTTMKNSLRSNVPPSFFNGKVTFSCLETLKLCSINMEKIWDDDHLSIAYIHNLANLTVEDCRGLKYLFSTSIIGSFQNLKQLEISKCDMMEEIIAVEGRNVAALKEVQFSKLETVVINNMKSLKKVWHFQFDGLKNLEVNNCEKLENIFPSHVQKTFRSLETLKVSDCGSMGVIFELAAYEIQREEDTTTHVTQLKKLHLLQLPKLKQIWSKDSKGILHFHNLQDVQVKHIWSRDSQLSLCFPNLQVVCVEECDDLEYLFPFSIAMDLLQLEEISVISSRSMKEIVSNMERPEESPEESPVRFELNHMTSLVLWGLDELEGFFAENHILTCPSLKVLDVSGCTKLKLFNTQYTSRQGRVSSNNLPVSIQQPLFNVEEVIGNIEKLNLDNEDASTLFQRRISTDQFCKVKFLRLFGLEDALAIFPYWILQNIISLEWLVIQSNSFEMIFTDEGPLDEKGQNEVKTHLKKLTLYQLHELQCICKERFKIDPVLEVLEYLDVDECSNLKHLVPSSVTFSHLTYLEVRNCNGLIELITSSTARSLVKLTTMKVGVCNSLEQVVGTDKDETEDEIEFSSLETLELESLPKLEMFCSNNCSMKLPLLKKFVLLRCPRVKSFSMRDPRAPILRKIQTDEQDEKWCWEGDLNTTVNKMFQDMVAFTSFIHLELSEYPELKELWHGQLHGQKFLCNLKRLVVHKCTFLSNIIFSSSSQQLLYTLEELEVTECDSLEAVFDVKVLEAKEMLSKEVSGLKKLILSDLPNLKHIWKEDPRETLSFKNLQVVKVVKCQNLKNLFMVSLSQDLKQLEELDIDSCGIEEIVAIDERLKELKFDFPLLTKFKLYNLMQLREFYPRRYTLECPSLKILNVHRCDAVQIFAFGHLDSQQLRVEGIDLPIQQALFYIEKVSKNLEQLSLNEKDAMMILDGHCDKNLIQSIEMLRLQYFQETPIIFLNSLLERFPGTTTFQVRNSSFKILFPSNKIGYCRIEGPTQIKTLWLFQLEQLMNIWNDDSVSDPLAQNLEHFFIMECSGLIRLAPPSISFSNLTTMEVEDCNGLIYLVTPVTARSLIRLKTLIVKNCGKLEEVVMTDEGDLEEAITFQSLKHLELTCLTSFKSFCFGKHTFIFPSMVRLKVTGCHKMQYFSSGVTIAPFLKIVVVDNGKKRWREDLNTTIKQLFMGKAIGEGDGGNKKECSSTITKSSQTHPRIASTSRASSLEKHEGQSKDDQIGDTGKQELHKLLTQDTGIDIQAGENTLSLTKVNAVVETREMHETIEGDLVQAADNTSGFTIVQDTEIRSNDILLNQVTVADMGENKALSTFPMEIQVMHGTDEEPLVQATEIAGSSPIYGAAVENTRSPPSTQEIAAGTHAMHEILERLLVQLAQNTHSLATIQDPDTKTPEMFGTIKRALVQAAQNLLNSNMVDNTAIDPSPSDVPEAMTSSIQDAALQTREMCETSERPLIQVDENALSPGIIHDAENSNDSDLRIQDMYETICIKKPVGQDAQNVQSSSMLHNNAASDVTSSLTVAADAYSSFKGMIDISEQNMPYLEAGLKRHPQVLHWLITKRRRVFAPLFTEVTHILRTTRRRDLTDDERNTIKECCTALEAVGFDASWLSYVYGCIEKCGDGEEIMRRLEEAKAKASTLRNELASIEASLVLLHDEAKRLDDFIDC